MTTELFKIKGQLKTERESRAAIERILEGSRVTIEDLKREIQCLHVGNASAREQIESLQSQAAARETTIRHLESEVTRLQRDLTQAQKAKEEAEKKLEMERLAMQEQIDALSARLEQQESSPAVVTAADLSTGNDMPPERGTTERTKDHE